MYKITKTKIARALETPTETKKDKQDQDALRRAVEGISEFNTAAIMEHFGRNGMTPSSIKPRINVFTFRDWRALGYQVKKGEHGCQIKVSVFGKDKETGKVCKYLKKVYVFHVSQVEKAA